jgi:hypothetical protein
MKESNPILVLSTNRFDQTTPLYCQAFLDFPGVQAIEVNKQKANRYIMDLHNEFIDTAAIVLNVSENVFVFDPEALFSLVTRLVMEKIECTGFTQSEGNVEMSDAFNIILPNTRISGKNYFAQMHQLEKDSFINYGTDNDCPGILLYNQAGIPFAIYAGTIKYFKSPVSDVMACYNYAIHKRNQYIENERAALA